MAGWRVPSPLPGQDFPSRRNRACQLFPPGHGTARDGHDADPHERIGVARLGVAGALGVLPHRDLVDHRERFHRRVVELQEDTKFYDTNGVLEPPVIAIGAEVEVEGVQPPKADAADPDLIRAALVFVEPEADEQLIGTITAAPAEMSRQFTLTTEDMMEHCIDVQEDADILLVDIMNSEVTMGAITDLVDGQVIDIFGETVAGECTFSANEVIVDLNASPPAP